MITPRLTQIKRINATVYVRLRCNCVSFVLRGVADADQGVESNGEVSSVMTLEVTLYQFSSSTAMRPRSLETLKSKTS